MSIFHMTEIMSNMMERSPRKVSLKPYRKDHDHRDTYALIPHLQASQKYTYWHSYLLPESLVLVPVTLRYHAYGFL